MSEFGKEHQHYPINNISIEYSGSKINTSLNGTAYFNGKLKKKWWKDIWMLIDSNNNKVSQYEIKGKYFKQSFDIILNQQSEILKLRYENKRPHLSFTHANNNFLIVWHLTNTYAIKYSIFENDIQIASLTKISKNWFWAHFTLLADDRTDLILLLQVVYLVILISENINKDPEYSEVAAYFKELKPFNDFWIDELRKIKASI